MTTFRRRAAFCHVKPGAFPTFIAAVFAASLACAGQAKPPEPPKPAPAPDVLTLSDGDTLHGKQVSEVAGKVTFHTDSLGDVVLAWDKIKELRTAQKFDVLDKNVKLRGKSTDSQIPSGTLEVANKTLSVHSESGAPHPPIPVGDAQYVVDHATLQKQIDHGPGFFSGWNGAATAGATLVTATQNQYTLTGAIGLVRAVPTVSWLNTRSRTSADFSGSYGRITQPAYTIPATSTTPATFVPESVVKSAISHFDAERDQYFSARVYALAQTAFDHNFSQDLSLQQIYGGGIGWTSMKSPNRQLDMKGSIQYEKQQFIQGSGSANQNLIGSTFAANFAARLKLFTYVQGVSFIPAYNETHAYSVNETDTFAFPAYRNFSFSMGTIDSYLNDPPASEPPTRRNSFQFTMGLTYAIKSKY